MTTRVIAFARLLLWFAAQFLVISVQASAAEAPSLSDIPNLTITYYDIHGMTAGELRSQMNELGPTDPNDHKRMDAVTLWNFRWNWPGYGSAQCDLVSGSVTYEIKMTLPRMADQGRVSAGLNEKWNTYISALVGHERGHAEFVVKEAPEVLKAIKSASCLTADAAAGHVLDIIRRHDRDYDAETNHGETQGASFP